MEQFKFHELVIGVMVGDVVDGDEFTTSIGASVIYKDGVLAWVTGGGYIGSPVSVTDDIIFEETFTLSKSVTVKELSFNEAMQYIAEGDVVTLDLGHAVYNLKKLEDIDDVITKYEYFTDVYKGKFTVEEQVVAEVAVAELASSEDHKGSGTLTVVDFPAGKKLNEIHAWEILHQYHFVKMPVTDIADAYGVSVRMIYYILDGTHWSEVHTNFHTEYDIVKDDYIR